MVQLYVNPIAKERKEDLWEIGTTDLAKDNFGAPLKRNLQEEEASPKRRGNVVLINKVLYTSLPFTFPIAHFINPILRWPQTFASWNFDIVTANLSILGTNFYRLGANFCTMTANFDTMTANF